MIFSYVRLDAGEQQAGGLWGAVNAANRLSNAFMIYHTLSEGSGSLALSRCRGQQVSLANKVQHCTRHCSNNIVARHWFLRHFWPGNQ